MTQRTRYWIQFVYLVEFFMLALPVLLMTQTAALFGIAFSAISFTYRASPLGAALLLSCLSSFVATGYFCRLSIAYLLEPAEKFRQHRKKLQSILIFAGAPLLLLGAMWSSILSTPGLRWQALPFLSSLLLFIPITHLWLALREAERATRSK